MAALVASLGLIAVGVWFFSMHRLHTLEDRCGAMGGWLDAALGRCYLTNCENRPDAVAVEDHQPLKCFVHIE
jgi:hypothetical protein